MHPELSESKTFVLLSKRRRRQTIRVLREAPAPSTVIELARQIANHECSNPTEEDFRTVYLALYHNHLPKLDEADVVEYDTNDGTVHPGVNFNRLDRTLAQVTEDDLPWSDASS